MFNYIVSNFFSLHPSYFSKFASGFIVLLSDAHFLQVPLWKLRGSRFSLLFSLKVNNTFSESIFSLVLKVRLGGQNNIFSGITPVAGSWFVVLYKWCFPPQLILSLCPCLWCLLLCVEISAPVNSHHSLLLRIYSIISSNNDSQHSLYSPFLEL